MANAGNYRQIFYSHSFSIRLHTTSIVYLPDIDKLLAAASGDDFGKLLALKSFHEGLNNVHRVPTAGNTGRKILNTKTSAHFKDM